MTQFVDFVALSWVDENLREEIDAARHCLHIYQREPEEQGHLRDAERHIHGATSALRLCALDPAALLTEEIERVLSQLYNGTIGGENRKLAMTELVAAIEALPAYLASVRASREATTASIASAVNDLRHFSNRPPLPASLFFNPPISATAGVTSDSEPANDSVLKEFAHGATRTCHKHSRPALEHSSDSLQLLHSMGMEANAKLVGTVLEPYFLCYSGFIEAMEQSRLRPDEVIVDVLKHCFSVLRSLSTDGQAALEQATPLPYIKKMMYYIGTVSAPSELQQSLLDTFEIDNVEAFTSANEGRIIQEDDLLDALGQTQQQLLDIMKFMSAPNQDISAANTTLVENIVPGLRQVGMQLDMIGLPEQAALIQEQYAVLAQFSQRSAATPPAELLDFGGALSAVKEALEYKLKNGLSASGDGVAQDLDSAITDQMLRCLTDMKSSINRELVRQGLQKMVDAPAQSIKVSISGLRPLFRAARQVQERELLDSMELWEDEGFPDTDTLQAIARDLLNQFQDSSLAQHALIDLKQVLSVLELLDNKNREREVLDQCARYISKSAELGGLVKDSSMTCFAETIAALEQYMERRREDPQGNFDSHLARAETRAKMLATFLSQRTSRANPVGNIVEFGLQYGDNRQSSNGNAISESADVVNLPSTETDADAIEHMGELSLDTGAIAQYHNEQPASPADNNPVEANTAGATSTRELPWREAMAIWTSESITREAEPASEGGEASFEDELRECFVEEGRDYIGKLETAAAQFSTDHGNEAVIQEIRTVFHTMKGSARTIDLNAFGGFLHAMEIVFNSLRDGYISGSAELAELVEGVAGRLGSFADLIAANVTLTDSDFSAPTAIANAFADKSFTDDFTVEIEVEVAAEIAGQPSDIEAGNNTTATTAYDHAMWQQHRADQIIDAISQQLDNASSAEEQEIAAQAERLVLCVVPALIELRDAQLIEPGADNVGCFLDLSGLEYLASGAIYGVIEDETGASEKVTVSNAVAALMSAYMDDINSSDQYRSSHSAAEALVLTALSLPVTGEDVTVETEQTPVESDNILDFKDSATAATPDEQYQVEDIDDELLDLFIETLDEYTESVDASVSGLAQRDESALRGLKNTLHTVKGAANSIGLRKLGTLVHEIESKLEDLEFKGDIYARESIDVIDGLVEEYSIATRFVRMNKADWDESAKADLDEAAAASDEQISAEQSAPQAAQATSNPVQSTAESRADTLRVKTHQIDRLLDVGLETSMSNVRCREALDTATQDRNEVQGLARRVLALVDKLSLQLDTEIQAKTGSMSEGREFDPLEMDRMTEKQGLAAILREAAYDLEEEAGELGKHLDTAMREANSASRMMQVNQSELRMLRLVNFSKLGPGFRRLVHQVSRQLGKQVEFDFSCGEGGLDVAIFEHIKIALEHMLRNAVDHGMGTPEERNSQGKAEYGTIKLDVMRQGSEFVIRLLDDGNGMDPERLRAKARQLGLIQPGERLSDEEALRLVLRAGFSTAESLTDVSGRGVGMDVVHQAINQVGGSINVQSKLGQFTQFDIRVPASIMVNGALMATVNEEQIAIPLTSLYGSDFHRRGEVHREATREGGRITFRDEEYEVRYLGSIRGNMPLPSLDMMPDFVPVLFAQLDQRKIAFFADALDSAEDVVIRSLGAQYTGVPGIAGGAIKPDGQAVLALDLNEFIRQVDHADELAGVTTSTVDVGTLILCVDDSVMMRRTYEKRLQSLGYKVVTAVDGEDALDYLSETKRVPDFIFTDLEMPNMNGFEFIANLRRVPKLDAIPTIVVSSRDAEKHRAEAQRVGATDFMAKGSNSADGMQAVIQRYLGTDAMAS